MGVKLFGAVIEKNPTSRCIKKKTTFRQFRREYNIYTPPFINIGKTKQSPRLG